jgi:lipoprotein-anchoring transpeptidase ErfK/SrfK
MTERTTRSGTPERRDYTPPGRLRRILFDYRGATLALVAGAALFAVLFAATAAWAVNERFERDVTRIAYTHDVEALRFLTSKEAEAASRLEQKAKQLEAEESSVVPANRPYLVVSIAERKVSYIKGNDTIFAAPVAVGSGKTLVLGGKTKRFQTPRGKMTITHKELDPVWVPPNWHYVEVARKRGLRVVDMSNASPNALAGFPAGKEPIRGGTIYIPPWGSPQRRHEGVLGVAKLEMYDGYYFHGTDNEKSIGTAASHGCIRMRKDDILWMYKNVPVGTPVYIY